MNRLERLVLERWLRGRVDDPAAIDAGSINDPELSYWENKRIIAEKLGIKEWSLEDLAATLVEMAAEHGDEEAAGLLEDLRRPRRRARRKKHVPRAAQPRDPLREVERVLGRRYLRHVVEVLSP